MKKYKYLIFDLDDTLLDFKDTEIKALELLFSKYDIPFEKDSVKKYRAINRRFWCDLEKGLVTKEEVLCNRFEEFFKIYGYDIKGRVVEDDYREYLNEGHKKLPNATELLEYLKDNDYKILAGTNGLGETQRRRLKDSGLIGLFDDLFISEEMGFEKPNVNFYKIIFDKYDDITKTNALMIGDSLTSDIQGACNFGIDSVWFNPLGKEASTVKPTYEISELMELLSIVNKEASVNA